jgi:hypothetical protein
MPFDSALIKIADKLGKQRSQHVSWTMAWISNERWSSTLVFVLCVRRVETNEIYSVCRMSKWIHLFFFFSRLAHDYHAYSVFFSLLKQEIAAYNELLHLIRSTCDKLRRALVGEIVVSEMLEDIQRTLLMHEIPRIWKVGRKKHWECLLHVTNVLEQERS